MGEKREEWGSRIGFILASLGMAVGTGNIWRFPRMVGTNDGGAFLIAYLVANLVWSAPLVMLEISIGKTTRLGTIGAFRDFMGKKYTWIGAWIGFTCLAIMFYYAVVLGWALRYFVYALTGAFKAGMDSEALWNSFIHDPSQTILFHLIAVLIGGYIVYRGVQGGLELANKIMIPSLFISLLIAAVWAIMQPGSGLGLEYLFVPKWASLGNPKVWLNAFAQSSWSTGAGWALMLTYATYMKEKDDIGVNSFMIVFGDACGAMLGALAVLPTVFALSATPQAAMDALKAGNTGLTFIYLAKLFPTMPGGQIVAAIFFLALSLAALSSLLPMIEVGVKNFIDAGYDRKKATLLISIGGFILGIPSAYSAAFLDNQDWVWGVGLLISGLLFAIAAYRYGIERIRTEIINKTSDIYIGRWWNYCIVLFPVMFAILFGWWVVQAISWYPDNWWDPFETFSVGTMVLQWAISAIVWFTLNYRLADWIKAKSPYITIDVTKSAAKEVK
ncbi:sodium-dependent transporter [Thermosediminibacter litoriperuensis]|uniref:NSS family neurotransmitter:Na+ symporter n=1 Tax=Thermosediminibacter litoriperuensis TaxID=291989 RepID=A0A5S5AHP6_9FIRM|nr:sodium-dependent transporter [Thermosediminibacter litoriperuensis]TYP49270.1 NSS family neurotransmitter:Na+ symporter [Thermosediminibacter litoriperuensis]